jgi:hypothetical protein
MATTKLVNPLEYAKKVIDEHIAKVKQNPKILDQVNGKNSKEYIKSYNSVLKALKNIKDDSNKELAIQYLETQEDILENELYPPTTQSAGKRKTHGTKKTASRKRVNKKRASNKKRGTQKRK